jgi:hypothetical protein
MSGYDWTVQRRCSRCRKVKPLSSFDGIILRCETCSKRAPICLKLPDPQEVASYLERCPGLRYKSHRFYYDTNRNGERSWIGIGTEIKRALRLYVLLRMAEGKEVPRDLPGPTEVLPQEAKLQARLEVQKAIKEGVLLRKPCEICGKPNTHAHHESYEFKDWLRVRWLCPRHHLAEHSMVYLVEVLRANPKRAREILAKTRAQ